MKIKVSFFRVYSLWKKYFLMSDENRQEFLLQIVSAVKKAYGTPEEIIIKANYLRLEQLLEIAMDVFKDLEIEANLISIDEKGMHFSVSTSDSDK